MAKEVVIGLKSMYPSIDIRRIYEELKAMNLRQIAFLALEDEEITHCVCVSGDMVRIKIYPCNDGCGALWIIPIYRELFS